MLGIFSLAICARILTPEDYGLVGMAMVVVGFSSILIQFGIDSSLIRTKDPSQQLYNTAWSLRIIQGFLIAIIIISCIPLATSFYNDARVAPVITTVAIAGFIGCLENIYVVDFRKKLNFKIDFLYLTIPRFISFVSAVSAVLILESYWGLVIGICVTEIARTINSYILAKKRPKWSLSEWRNLLSFSGWYMLRGIGDFLSFETDRFIIGSLGGPRLTGIFSVAKEIASLPSSELVLPIGRALFPTLSLIANQGDRFKQAVEKAISATMIISAPAALGFMLISNEIVLILFGVRWLDAIPILEVLSIGSIFVSFRHSTGSVFLVTGQLRFSAIVSWIQAGLILGFSYPVFKSFELYGLAWLIVLVSLLTTCIYAIKLNNMGMLSYSKLLVNINRPILCALIMLISTKYFVEFLLTFDMNSLILLALKIIIAATIYTVSLLALWFVSGRPRSSEHALINLVISRLNVRKR
jgi:O-antigen/teichoic acid export membrane protein